MSTDIEHDVVVAQALRRLLDEHDHTHVFSGARRIADEPSHPGEQALYIGVVDKVRRATSTGRALARQVLRQLGVVPQAMLRTTGGQVAWPIGIVGSIAHDDDVAVCVVDGGGVRGTIGVDVEPALPLPAEIVNDVAVTAHERDVVADDLIAARLLFCAKEAVFKACFATDAVFLEHADVQLVSSSLASSSTFTTSTGHTLEVVLARTPRLLAFTRCRGGQTSM